MIDLEKPVAYVLRFVEDKSRNNQYPHGEYLIYEIFCSGRPCVGATDYLECASRFTWEASQRILQEGVGNLNQDFIEPSELEAICIPEYIGHGSCSQMPLIDDGLPF